MRETDDFMQNVWIFNRNERFPETISVLLFHIELNRSDRFCSLHLENLWYLFDTAGEMCVHKHFFFLQIHFFVDKISLRSQYSSFGTLKFFKIHICFAFQWWLAFFTKSPIPIRIDFTHKIICRKKSTYNWKPVEMWNFFVDELNPKSV